MIYRNWSLLSSTVVIWGSVATAGLAGIFLFGGKSFGGPRWVWDDMVEQGYVPKRRNLQRDSAEWEKFQDYICREGERLRQQDRAAMGKN